MPKTIRKRGIVRAATLKTDIYVSRKSAYPALLKRATQLLEDNTIKSFVIHGMGAALNRAIELALELQQSYPQRFKWDITTDTVKLIDDVEEEASSSVETRCNSAIHIAINKLE